MAIIIRLSFLGTRRARTAILVALAQPTGASIDVIADAANGNWHGTAGVVIIGLK